MSKPGDRIRELRLRHRLTLDDVARTLGVGRQAVYKYEQGTVTNIPLDNLEKMAFLFGTTPGYLAGWTDDDPSQEDLTADEAQLLNSYRVLPDPGKQYIHQQLRAAQLMFGEKSADISNSVTGRSEMK